MKSQVVIAMASIMLALGSCGNNADQSSTNVPDVVVPQLTGGKKLFVDNCAVCHTLKKDKMGPALEGSLARWNNDTSKLIAFIRNSPAYIQTGDEYARALYEKWNKATMTPFPNLTDEQILQIIDYMESSGD